jgi:hypothetical protein
MSTTDILPDPGPDISPEDQNLDYAQNVRKQYIRQLSEKGDKLLDNPEQFNMLDKMLTGLERVSLGRKRIKADTTIADVNKQAAELIACILNNQNAIQTSTVIDVEVTNRPKPALPDLGYEVVLVEGELIEQGISEDYAAFMQRMQDEGKIKPDGSMNS